MTDAEMLVMLKYDLQIPNTAQDTFLAHCLNRSKINMEQFGIVVDRTLETQGVQIEYAAYLFRKRGSENTAPPRFLINDLNRLLFKQKGAVIN